MSLLVLALGSIALYFGLTRSGGVGLPGGKSALEQTLAPYVEAGSVSVSQPRIAYLDDGQGVMLTLRSAQFVLAGGKTQVDLRGIRARLDAARLSSGAIRIQEVEIARAALSHDLQDGEDRVDNAPLLDFKSAFDDLSGAYDAAFADLHLDQLAALDIKRLSLELTQDGADLMRGQGGLVLRPAGETLQLNADLDWRGEEAVVGDFETQLFAIAGPNRSLDLVITATSQTLELMVGETRIATDNMSVQAELTVGAGNAGETQWDVTASSVSLAPGNHYENGADFTNVTLSTRYQAGPDTLRIGVEDVSLGDTVFTAQAAVEQVSTEQATVSSKGGFSTMDLATLKAYWPIGVGEGGRLWIVENMEAAKLINPSFKLDAAVAALKDDTAPSNALEFSFGLEQATAHYRRPMPPLVDAFATARMSLDNVRFDIASGSIGGVDVAGSTVLLTSFRQSPQRAEITLRVNGDAGGLARVLDSAPLGYFTAYGMQPSSLSGTISGRSLIALPLVKDVLMDDVRISARIDANRMKLSDVVEGADARLRRVVIDLTQDGMKLRGDYDIDGLTGAVRWEEDFRGIVDAPTQMSLVGQITPEGVLRWLPGAGDILFGTVFYDATISGRGAEIAQARLTGDLTTSEISIPELGYEKPVGEPAEFYTTLKSENDVLLFEAVTLNGPGLMIIGDGQLNSVQTTATIALQTVEVGETKGALTLSRERENWLLAGTLDTLDVRPIISMFWSGGLAPPAGEEAKPEDGGVLSVSIDAREILLENEQAAGQTRFLGTVQGDHIRQLNVFGTGPADAPFTLTIEPIESGRRLVLAAQEAGALASGLDMLKTAEGGRLSIQATSFDRGEEQGLAGILEMTDIRLRETPILARLLGLGSLSGVADLARNRGINFTDVEVPFEVNNSVIRVSNASAYGPAMGLTADGEFLDSFEKADIRGVIVPSYTINSALGKVPVLGNLIMGGEKTGLFGINYKIGGALDDPDIDVNPASVLTPGFLRGIFGRQRGRLGEVTSEPLAPTADAGGL